METIYAESRFINRMAKYKLVTRMTDSGPYIRKLILDLGCEVGVNDLSPEHFNVYCQRREADGSILMRQERGAPKALPSVGYQQVRAAYPCTPEGVMQPRSRFAALELAEERLGKRIEGNVFASRYIQNCYRVTQLKPFPSSTPDEAPVTGLVFDTCGGEIAPELKGWSNAANTMRYGFFTPKHETGEKLPLVIWLHGAGEGGDDTLVAYTGNRVTALSGAHLQNSFGGAAWILVPQCPTVWMDDGKEKLGRSNRSIYSKSLKACIDGFIEDHQDEIDTDRIYLTGVSNGGFMTVRMLLDYPGFFAAAAPGCTPFYEENITEEVLGKLEKVPIWFTHAKGDELVDPKETVLPLYKGLKAVNAPNVHLTYWNEVKDPTGEYRDAEGRFKKYFNHAVWVLMLNDACRTEIDGSLVLEDGVPVTLWEWLGAQRRQ